MAKIKKIELTDLSILEIQNKSTYLEIDEKIDHILSTYKRKNLYLNILFYNILENKKMTINKFKEYVKKIQYVDFNINLEKNTNNNRQKTIFSLLFNKEFELIRNMEQSYFMSCIGYIPPHLLANAVDNDPNKIDNLIELYTKFFDNTYNSAAYNILNTSINNFSLEFMTKDNVIKLIGFTKKLSANNRRLFDLSIKNGYFKGNFHIGNIHKNDLFQVIELACKHNDAELFEKIILHTKKNNMNDIFTNTFTVTYIAGATDPKIFDLYFNHVNIISNGIYENAKVYLFVESVKQNNFELFKYILFKTDYDMKNYTNKIRLFNDYKDGKPEFMFYAIALDYYKITSVKENDLEKYNLTKEMLEYIKNEISKNDEYSIKLSKALKNCNALKILPFLKENATNYLNDNVRYFAENLSLLTNDNIDKLAKALTYIKLKNNKDVDEEISENIEI